MSAEQEPTSKFRAPVEWYGGRALKGNVDLATGEIVETVVDRPEYKPEYELDEA